MNIADFDIYQYTLQLHGPIQVRDRQLQHRQGLIIHLKSQDGVDGFGEVAPLEGFSRETLAEARDQLQFLKTKLCGQMIPEKLTSFSGRFGQWLNPFGLKPSVRFGIESAVLHLLANTQNVPLYKLFPTATNHRVQITGLLSGSKDEIVKQTKTLIEAGFTELKLKVGADVEEDIAKVLAVNDIAYGKTLIHLDANQMWNFDEAVTFAKTIGCAAVSYIEEPFGDTTKIPDFFDQTLIPVALDESVQKLTLEEIKSISGVETIILKPTIIGGIEKTLQLMTQAEDFALDAVISSTFESSFGIWVLANIVETSSHRTAAGLDTLKWFKNDVLKQPLPIERGVIYAEQKTIRETDINLDLLEKL